MSKIFIHAGAHKTGTSFLQANLVANAAPFEKQGWRVIWLQKEFKKARDDIVKIRANKPRKADATNLPKVRVTKHLNQLFEEIRNDPRDVFLTYEGFLGSSSMANGVIYDNHEASIKALKEGFAGRQIQIAFCIRDFADQAESSYNSRLVRGKLKRSFAEYAKGISTEKLSWLKIIEHLSDTFGTENLVLWTFEDFRKDGVAAFAKIVQAAGIDTTDIAPAVTTPQNVSLTIPQLQLLRVWRKALRNHVKISPKDAKGVSEKLYNLLGRLPRTTPAKGLLAPEMRKELTAHYEQELAIIRERWGSQMLDFSARTSARRSSAPERSASLTA